MNKKNTYISSILPEKTIEKMLRNRTVRTAITEQSHFLFFYFYLAHYVKHKTASFQREIFSLTEDESAQNVIIVAFRGSAKSTIMTVSYPIWAILGKQQKKFVLIVCQTMTQARRHMSNLRQELESNELLKNDLGPFKDDANEWGMLSVVFPKLNARISIASIEQSVRGLRHAQHRPDLIIGDDLEDIDSTRTREGRDKTYERLTGDIIPAGDQNTRLILIGNLLHEDSLLMRLKQSIEEGTFDGIFKKYPLLDEETGECLWPGKYPDQAAILAEKKKIGSEIAWQREYLLRIVYDHMQVILPEWIQYYDALPERKHHMATLIGIDLAISEKSTADYTAMVTGIVSEENDKFSLYILPNPVNKRLDFSKTRIQACDLYDSLKMIYRKPVMLIESVGYQEALVQVLAGDGYNAESIKVTSDKRSRLALAAPLMESGRIFFPKQGAEDILSQMIGFGTERHDDLVDAFSIVVHRFVHEENRPRPSITSIENIWGNNHRIRRPFFMSFNEF